jgi:hypothetical protein
MQLIARETREKALKMEISEEKTVSWKKSLFGD